MKRTLLCSILVGVIGFLTPAFSQIGLSVNSESGYLGNAFSNYKGTPDYYTGIDATFSYAWADDRKGLQLGYQGTLNAFKQYRDRTFHDHSAKLAYYRYWSEEGHRLNAGVEVGKKLHSDAYRWYEWQQASGYANVKLNLAEQFYAYLGVTFRLRDYALLDAFSHWQSSLYWRVSRFFDSGTTLILEADLFTKRYRPSGATSSVEGLPEIVTLGDGTSRQVVGLLRMAQAISTQTGLSAELLWHKNLLNSARYLGNPEGSYYSDEELFDDIYGYDGPEFSVNLKQNLPWRMKLTIGSGLAQKNYEQRPALTLDGSPFDDGRLRQDTRSSAWLTLQKALPLGSGWQPLAFSINWTGIHNRSNDPYYQYGSGFFSVGISQEF